MDKAFLLGLGFDSKDGHKRITLAEHYKIYGGSKETHELMREKCAKFNEKLKKRKKTLTQLTYNEFHEIAREVGLKQVTGRRKRPEA